MTCVARKAQIRCRACENLSGDSKRFYPQDRSTSGNSFNVLLLKQMNLGAAASDFYFTNP